VGIALLRLLDTAADVARHDWQRLHEIGDQARLLAAAAEREVVEPADVQPVLDAGHALVRKIERYRSEAS
jgi:hypothetical protein